MMAVEALVSLAALVMAVEVNDSLLLYDNLWSE